MGENIRFKDLFSVMNISRLTIIDDMITFDERRSAVLYDYLLRSETEKQRFLDELLSLDFKKEKVLFEDIRLEYEKVSDRIIWENVPARDIEYYIENNDLYHLKAKIDRLIPDMLCGISDITKKYGFGIKDKTEIGYAELLHDAKQCLELSIYTDFTAKELKNIQEDTKNRSNLNQYSLYIIDNYIGRNQRGRDIINDILDIPGEKKYRILFVISSQLEKIESNTPDMYIGFIHRTSNQLDAEIKQSLIFSQYKTILNLIIKKRRDALEMAFKYASENMDTAIYLSKMAREEGITNHEILNEWIDMRAGYYLSNSNNEEIKRTMVLSGLLESIDVDQEKDIITQPEDITQFQTFEQYDYSINDMYAPPMLGDIFKIKNDYYMLIGQECDLSIRDGKRHNPIAELVEVKVLNNKDMGKFKEKVAYNKLMVGKFKTLEGEFVTITIDCTKRFVIDNEILDICSFNNQGKAWIELNHNLDLETKYMLSAEWQQYYYSLKSKIRKLKEKMDRIKEMKSELRFTVQDLIDDLGASHNNRLLSIIEFETSDSKVIYDVHRICRIKKYGLLIHKLWLEYCGRQGFNTINMDVGRETTLVIKLENNMKQVSGKKVTEILTTNRNQNDLNKAHQRIWIVDKNTLKESIKELDAELFEKNGCLFNELEDNIILENKTGFIVPGKLQYRKQAKSKENEVFLNVKFV